MAAELESVFLLGGSGYLGSAVVRKLVETGVRVRMLVHTSEGENRNPLIEKIPGSMATFDWKSLQHDLPDAILHMARISGRTGTGRLIAGYRGYYANSRMIRQLASIPASPRVIFTSGTLVYGSCGPEPADERTPLNPVGFQRYYVKAEYPFLGALGSDTVPVSIVRPPWIYGPGSWFRQFYYSSIIKSGVVPQFGNGANLMSLIHVDDCAALIKKVATMGATGTVYNLHTGSALTNETFCRILADITGSKVGIIPDEVLLRKYGKTVYEALTFSLNSTSRHKMIRDFPAAYVDHRSGLRQVIAQLDQMELRQ